jgi:hypothetical protein
MVGIKQRKQLGGTRLLDYLHLCPLNFVLQRNILYSLQHHLKNFVIYMFFYLQQCPLNSVSICTVLPT